MPAIIEHDILKKFRESFLRDNTNTSEQKQWDAILEYHFSLQKYNKELVDFFAGTDLDVRKAIENLIDDLVLMNKTMNSYKRSLQVAPNQNPDKYIKEYITQVEETFSKQITHAKREVVDFITSKNDSEQITAMMRIYNLMLKVHSQIRAESTKAITPQVQVEQNKRQDNKTSKEQSSFRTLKATSHTSTRVHQEADSPKHRSSGPNR